MRFSGKSSRPIFSSPRTVSFWCSIRAELGGLTGEDKTFCWKISFDSVIKGANVGDKVEHDVRYLDDLPTSPVIARGHAGKESAAHREKSRVREIIGVSGVFGCAFCGRRFEKLCFEERWW